LQIVLQYFIAGKKIITAPVARLQHIIFMMRIIH
jgi:hypothetical protein